MPPRLDIKHNLLRTVPWTVALGAYTLAVAWIDAFEDGAIRLSATFHTLIGLMLGLLLVFRTNTAYDRWWEGRKLWGQLLNECRNFAIKIETCVRAEPRDKAEVGQRLTDFACALKDHLRGKQPRLQDYAGFRDATDSPSHVPVYIAQQIYDRIERWRHSEQLGGFELLFIDRHSSALMDICGGCERILKTPISYGYRRFIRQAIAVYLLTLPWGLVDYFGYWSAPVTMVVGYMMIGIEVLAEDVEGPFGTDPDDLPLESICESIERSVRQIIHE